MSILPETLLAASAFLWFEVMDKEPALAQRVALYGILSVVGWLLSRKRWWLGLLVLPIVGAFAWGDVSELRDPFVGPAIMEEAGLSYVVGLYTCIVVGIGAPVLTAEIARRRASR